MFIFFDLGSNFGYTTVQEKDFVEEIKLNSQQNLKIKNIGERLLLFERKILQLIEKDYNNFFCYEFVMRHISTRASHFYGALEGILQKICFEKKIKLVPLNVAHHKKVVTGNGRCSKEETISEIKSYGFYPKNSDEADSFSVFLTFLLDNLKMKKTEINLALDFIKECEGFSPTPYKCPAGVTTIGYGETGLNISKTTPEESEKRIRKRIIEILCFLLNKGLTNLSFCQRTALISFIYNLGEKNFITSTLYKKLQSFSANDFEKAEKIVEIQNEIKKWNKSKGRVLQGLVQRRQKEADFFSKIK